MALTAADYVKLINALTPVGPAWSDDTVRSIWAQEYARLDARIWTLFEEADPRTATELLGDWERVLGLPDECMSDETLTLTERRRLAYAKLTEEGGQSKAYFIALAARYGEADVKIADGARPMNCNDDCNAALYSAADRFVWQVRLQHPADDVRPMNCNDDCNDALQLYTRALAECPITERKPAHTTVVFRYQPAPDTLFSLITKFALVDSTVLDF
jgi:uncharacterized protein YmfQ (DUF2313 family)